VNQVVLPCTGKLQPEHLLKAFEAGADMVCVVACEEDNCHCLEGSRRAIQRAQYVKGLLDEAGLGGERLLIFHLPGTAREDMALGCGLESRPAPGEATRTGIPSCLETICDEIMAKLESLGPNPLREDGAAHRAANMETA
jgi:coenzyme F420-reducing hydrogenase delta subunit